MKQETSITKKIVLTALFTALTMVATMLIRIPLPIGYVNLGDTFVFLSAFLLGPLWGTVAAGLGSALADVFGYITYAPATLVIKAAMAFLGWLVYSATKKALNKPVVGEILAGCVGTIVLAFGYFLFEAVLYSTVEVALVNVPWNILQGASGIILSTAIMRVLAATKLLDRFQTKNNG